MLTHILLCCAGVTILLPTLPANYSPGVLGKQTKPSPDIMLKRGKGICDSHWQWKWQQLWAQLMGKHPASAASQHEEAANTEQPIRVGWRWRAGGTSDGARLAFRFGCCAVLRVQPLWHMCSFQSHGQWVFPGLVLVQPLPPAQPACSQFPRQDASALRQRFVILASQKQ